MKGDPLVRLFFSLLLFGLCGSLTWAQPADDRTKVETQPPAERWLAKMSLEQRVGQLLILGFSGQQLRPSVRKTIDYMHPGSVILFKHNVRSLSQVAELNQKLQSYARKSLDLPLFIMVDQEGGPVARIKTHPPLPAALAMGNSNDPNLVQDLGRHMGDLLRTLGFNMNLAPVLDIGDPLRKSFIGNRAFGGDPQKVSEMALAFSKGLSAASVVPTAKHFPGHGGLSQDSHKKTPSKLISLEELEATDLVPFKNYAELKPPTAVMVAHVSYPNIDPSGLPAAFSETMIREVLRGHLGYKGLVITDDIEMLGADAAGPIEERAIRAVEAGCDMVMVAWSPRRQLRAFRGLLNAVKSGRISETRLNESVLRILIAKLQLMPPQADGQKEFRKQIKQQLSALSLVTKQIAKANFKQGRATATTKMDRVPANQSLVVFSSDPAFYSEFLSAKPKNKTKFIRLTPSTLSHVEPYLKAHPSAMAIYFASGSVTAKNLNGLSREIKQRLMVVNGAYPGAVDSREHFKLVLDLNTPAPESGRWLAESFLEGTLMPLEDFPADIREPSSKEDAPDDQAARPRRRRTKRL